MIKTKNKFISILMSMLMVITILMPIIGLKASAKTINTTCTTKLIYYNSNPSPNVPTKQRTSVDITFNYNGKQYTVRGYCIHPGDSAAVDGTYPCEIVENADGTVTVTAQPFKNKKRVAPWNKIHPQAQKHTVPEWRNKPNKVQWFRGTFKPVTTGYAKLKKVTANNKHLTNGCSQYSLAGAEYGVYSDSGLKNKVGTFTTNANGDSNTISLKAGTYYVKELKAPKGYKLDEKTHRTVVTEGKTATVEVTDTPLLDPLKWNIVSKTVKEGADKNLTVEGAEFTVKYFDTLDRNVDGKTPVRTWKFKADKNGLVRWDKSYLLENQPELYKDESGKNVGKIGTYTVEETIAPKGYILSETETEFTINNDGKPQRVVMFNEPISIHTTAKDKADGDKYLKPQGKQTIIDTVAYKGLTVGKEYTIKTTLMNKRTNKPIMENGKPVVVESKFVAEKMQGTVDVEIEVDVTKLAGEKVVVFEEVYYDEHGINNTVFWSRCIS